LFFSPFSFGHCIVCSSIYVFWLPLWYLQTLQIIDWGIVKPWTCQQKCDILTGIPVFLRKISISYWFVIKSILISDITLKDKTQTYYVKKLTLYFCIKKSIFTAMSLLSSEDFNVLVFLKNDFANIVSWNLTQARCTRFSIMWNSLSVTCDKSVVSSTNKTHFTHSHDITEILLKVALNTITPPKKENVTVQFF